eukprot:TRINITY_DN4129_c0_g1_i2.p1 TRINITY_DN4129_c0_g1~~TRINITY_DN4129_c0_g1_i2.p1  ORF type:complete len:201 (-),score=54.26 TRINITY_DN4129_c0_g1_i2:282-884(-)
MSAFAAMDANHDGVVDKQEFAAAVSAGDMSVASLAEASVVVVEQPLAVTEPLVAALEQPVVETRQPVVLTYVQPTYVPSVPQAYVCSPGPVYTPGEEHPLITLTTGMRVVYTSRSNGQKYPATVLQRIPTGYLLKLDVDGGIKEIEDAEMWRLEGEADGSEQSSEQSTQAGTDHEKESTAKPLKSKKAKKASSKNTKLCC